MKALIFNQKSFSAAKRLLLCAFFSLSSLAIINLLLFEKINNAEKKAKLAKFQEIYPQLQADISEKYKIDERGRKIFTNSEKEILFVEAMTNKGYSGEIKVLIGINKINCNLVGVRILEHKETPGLGDKIETRISNWILNFNGKSIKNTNFKVKKDGGDFDAFTGATITPRAVVELVGEVLLDAEKKYCN
ncbi:MAG: RnfABCDGE type electron transport complex subunit G [Cardiobacteriaceae bacterium]|nr:RnfABCDGE type electron transport complex subunit G [Cardiobacteriaceae bacterium]